MEKRPTNEFTARQLVTTNNTKWTNHCVGRQMKTENFNYRKSIANLLFQHSFELMHQRFNLKQPKLNRIEWKESKLTRFLPKFYRKKPQNHAKTKTIERPHEFYRKKKNWNWKRNWSQLWKKWRHLRMSHPFEATWKTALNLPIDRDFHFLVSPPQRAKHCLRQVVIPLDCVQIISVYPPAQHIKYWLFFSLQQTPLQLMFCHQFASLSHPNAEKVFLQLLK